jgi:hypothetical protein
MKTLSLNSPIKVITSGSVPTTSNLKEGELAYGVVDGKLKLFCRIDDTVFDFTDFVMLSVQETP